MHELPDSSLTFKASPKIGLALGSGAARGLAHIGVLNALDDAGIPIDYIAGSSIGALVGAAYAADSMNRIVEFINQSDWRKMAGYFDFNFPQKGLLIGRRWMDMMNSFLAVDTFEELNVPLCITATELMTGAEIRLCEGNLPQALRASTSLPGIFNPFELNGSLMVDGGITNPIPIDVARSLGADIVIAVNLNTNIVQRNERKKSIRSSNKISRKTQIKNRLQQPKSPPDWVPQSLEEKYADFQQSIRQSLLQWVRDDQKDKTRELNIFDIITNSINIMEYQITQTKLQQEPPDILIEPELDHLNLLDYHEAESTISEGYRKMQEQIETLEDLIF